MSRLGQVQAESFKSAFLIFLKVPKVRCDFLKLSLFWLISIFFDQPDFFHKKLGLWLKQTDKVLFFGHSLFLQREKID